MSGIIAPFQLDHNKVVTFKILQKDIVGGIETFNMKLGADYNISDISIKANKYSARLDVLIELEGTTGEEEHYFDVELDMMGVFHGDVNSMDEEKFIEMLKINGVSTLMQLCRAYITSITALSGFGKPINFPMVNIFELNKLKEEKKK